MPNAPKGAVSKIAVTATVNIVLPHDKPIARGTPPIAACTVAFGVYAIMQNILSFIVSFVLIRHKNTPAILNTSTHKIKTIDVPPADTAYLISTVAPTKTNKTISATTHNLLNFADNLLATTSLFFCKRFRLPLPQ